MACPEKCLTCILHIGRTSTEDVKPIEDNHWTNIVNAKLARQATTKFKTSKYARVCNNLPDTYDRELHGFHAQCYSHFTAISQPPVPRKDDPKCIPVLRSCVERTQTASTSGIVQPICIFCKTVRKRNKSTFECLGQCETPEANKSVKAAAEILQDDAFLAKYGDIEFMAKEVKYHHSCKRKYIASAERKEVLESKIPTEYSSIRDVHQNTFEQLSEYVQTYIIDRKRCEFMKSVYNRYCDMLEGSEQVAGDTYKVQKLTDKILRQFGYVLVVTKSSKKGGNVLHHKDVDPAYAQECALQFATSDLYTVSKTAMQLRRIILKLLQTQGLPSPMTTSVFKAGQTDTHEELKHFLRCLITGSEKAQDKDSRSERYVSSIADDIVYTTTRGNVKPAKHMCVGLGLKSLTGSRKVVEILNRLGHCVGYSTVEELETDLAMTVVNKEEMLPDGLVAQKNLATGTAWDNYDELTETLSGAGTLHDTFGICYQNLDPAQVTQQSGQPESPQSADQVGSIGPEAAAHSDQETTNRNRSRKRSLCVTDKTLEPYRKKPKIGDFSYQKSHGSEPSNMMKVCQRDTLWMMSTALLDNIPMWVGWNSVVTPDPLPEQKIGYMENICLPPTRLDVVVETMKRSQKVAEECGDDYAVVSYDLAVAKLALRIQSEESPKYDNIFVCLGAFHICLAYFAAIGYILEESGGPQILVETGVLSLGSTNGFVSGRHYNRCKRLHPLLANAMRVLHFRCFLKSNGPLPNQFIEQLTKLNDDPSPATLEVFEATDVYQEVMTKYTKYSENTRRGDHGVNAQFWMVYMDLVALYLTFSRAVRTNDMDLYTHCLGEMCPVFFMTNRPNYSRYGLRFYLNLLNVESTHPGVRDSLVSGALSVRRTSKSFSRLAVDQTLECTVNADAASRTSGIVAFSNSEETRRRWTVAHAARSEIVGLLMEMTGLKQKEDCTRELRPHRITHDNENLHQVIDRINDTLNPFSVQENEQLFCLTTGKAVPNEVADDLLNCKERGKQWCEEFASGCFGDAKRFEKPIKRRKVRNFASSAVKVRLAGKDRKLQELTGTRDLFGRLLYLATTQNLDLSVVLSYPLTPVPLSLGHVDGIKHQTDKAKLMHELESRIDSQPPQTIEAAVFDAMFVIRSLGQIPATYSGVADLVLTRILIADRVDFVCDSYTGDATIKDMEHMACGSPESSTGYVITGPEQNIPKEFNTLLKFSSYKKSLLHFLAGEWKEPKYTAKIGHRNLYVGLADQAWVYARDGDTVSREPVPALRCSHEEADTRIVWHLRHISDSSLLGNDVNVVVRCDDTDIVVTLLMHVAGLSLHLWMDVGKSANNTRRYIDITSLAIQLSPDFCRALPGFHAFTGCDYTAAFFKKGKLRPLSIMEKGNFLGTFGTLGESETLANEVVVQLQKFVCAMYGKPRLESTDHARYAVFSDKFAPKYQSQPLEKIKKVEPSILPPSQPVLLQKIKRTNLVAATWKGAATETPCTWKPENNGWKRVDGKYEFVWFESNQMPDSVCEHIDESTCDDEDDAIQEYCSSSDEDCDD